MNELMERQKNKIEFQFNKEKANAVILYLAQKDSSISKMRLLKYVFFADLYHINKYGRPILGDKYVAMKNGPVLSKLYDMLKYSSRDYKIEQNVLIIPNKEPDLDFLSKSDIEALDYSLQKYAGYETFTMSSLTHEYAAWKNARDNFPKDNAPLMKWEDMIEDKEILTRLQEYSKAIEF